jgi:hypothetical protein
VAIWGDFEKSEDTSPQNLILYETIEDCKTMFSITDGAYSTHPIVQLGFPPSATTPEHVINQRLLKVEFAIPLIVPDKEEERDDNTDKPFNEDDTAFNFLVNLNRFLENATVTKTHVPTLDRIVDLIKQNKIYTYQTSDDMNDEVKKFFAKVEESKLKVKANNPQGIVEFLQQKIAKDPEEKTTDKPIATTTKGKSNKELLLRKTGSRKLNVVLIVPLQTKIHNIIPS